MDSILSATIQSNSVFSMDLYEESRMQHHCLSLTSLPSFTASGPASLLPQH
jgi:hypothetical protein